MSVRTRVFRFRLTEAEDKRLSRRAEKAGLTKADVIRKALRWPLAGEPTPPAGEAAEKVIERAKATGKAADPDTEPGAAALQQVAQRIAGKR